MKTGDGAAEGQRRVCLPGGEVIINAQAELLEIAVEAGFSCGEGNAGGGCRESL